MHDPRTSPTLRTLTELTGGPPPPRWRWSICRLDDAGRLCIPQAGTTAMGPTPWSLRWHRLAIVLETGAADRSPVISIDSRRRLLVPAWLRAQGRNVLLGIDHRQPRLLVAPVGVLDRFGDVLAGDR